MTFFDDLEQAVRAGFRPCKRCHAGGRPSATAALVEKACRLLESGEEPPRVGAVARAVGMTPASFARAFRASLGISPRQYRQRVMARRARKALATASTVTEAVYRAGYSASSRFYEGAGRELGMTPRRAQRRGDGEQVRFAVRPTSLGLLGVAWTDRGIADLFFVDDGAEVEDEVSRRWPAAVRTRAAPPGWLGRIVAAVERPAAVDVPLDIQGTAFQERVWQEARRIPRGETRSYSEVAAALGAPGSSRAVARALGQNRIAVLVPCHRVVARDGSLGGYRWGVDRKRELLRREAEGAARARGRAPSA